MLLLICSRILFCQAPHSLKYQAVAREVTGEIMTEQEVNFQISILKVIPRERRSILNNILKPPTRLDWWI